MRSVVVLVSAIAMLLTVPARTQEIPRKDAEDRVFGWMKIYDFKDATAPMTVDHRVYSAAQLSVANNFANWIQQSYVPVGGLGDVIRFVSAKLTAGNQETKSLPQSYGAIAKIYSVLKYGAAGKVELLATDHILWKSQRERGLRRTRDRTQHAGAVLLHAPEVLRTGNELRR